MLIRFITENFLSFNEMTILSLVSGKQRIHPNHKINIGTTSNTFNILRSAVVYGANASGKSNLIKSIHFARTLIIKGTQAKSNIGLTRFKLRDSNLKKASLFQFEIYCDHSMYNYGFKTTTESIEEEWLYEISKNGNMIPIFERIKDSYTFHLKFKNKEEKQIFNFVSKGTRKNQLFLTESIDRNIPNFNSIFEWFQNLTIITPDMSFAGLEARLHEGQAELADFIMDGLKRFDTGIQKLFLQVVEAIPSIIGLPIDLLEDIKNDQKLSAGSYFYVHDSKNDDRIVLHKDVNNELKALKLKTIHKNIETGKEHIFDISDESDGTRRILDLLPALLNLSTKNQVYLIDELDRSLHPKLSKDFLTQFYKFAEGSNSQLIITTHETTLMDFELLRKDEIWFVEKNVNGESKLYSLEEFQPRYDKDIRRGYLLGRFGALPCLKSI